MLFIGDKSSAARVSSEVPRCRVFPGKKAHYLRDSTLASLFFGNTKVTSGRYAEDSFEHRDECAWALIS